MPVIARSPARRYFVVSIITAGLAYVVASTYTALLAVYLHDLEATTSAVPLSALMIGLSFLVSVALAGSADWRPSLPIALALLSGGAAMLIYSSKLGFSLITIGTGLLRPAIMSRIAQARPEGMRRDEAFRFLVGTLNLAYIAGPFFADAMRFRVGWASVHVAMAVIAGLAAVLSLAGMSQVRRLESNPQNQIKRVNASLLVILAAVSMFYGISTQNTGALSLLVEHEMTPLSIGAWTCTLHAGSLAALHGLLVLIGSLVCGSHLLGNGAFLSVVGLVAYSAAFGLLAGIGYPASQWWMVVTFLLLSAGETLVSPSLLALGSRIAGGRRGLYWLASMVGYFSGGAVGVLWERWSHGFYFGVIAATCWVVAGLVLWRADDPEWR